MPSEPALVTSVEVARRKGCTGMAVRNAVKRGQLNAVKLGPVWAIVDDAALAAWQVREFGGRLHKAWRDNADDSADSPAAGDDAAGDAAPEA